MRAFVLLLALLLAGPGAWAAGGHRYTATVTSVVDGDTVWVRPLHGRPTVEIRVQGIDAPERCQPGGQRSREALKQHLLDRRVQVQERARDAYGRHLARLAREGEDVGAWMVLNGFAWSGSWRGRGPYDDLQAQARAARRGLWAQVGAMEPRQFRKVHGPCPRH